MASAAAEWVTWNPVRFLMTLTLRFYKLPEYSRRLVVNDAITNTFFLCVPGVLFLLPATLLTDSPAVLLPFYAVGFAPVTAGVPVSVMGFSRQARGWTSERAVRDWLQTRTCAWSGVLAWILSLALAITILWLLP